MNKKIKKTVLLGAMLAGLALALPVNAESIALSELNSPSVAGQKPSGGRKTLDRNHWAYKTLENISKKYGVPIDDDKAYITRDEAAILFVNLIGEVEQRRLKLGEAEKAKLEIIQEELGSELTALTGRVQAIEKGVAALEGRISAMEQRDKKLWGHAYGEDFKITGGARAGFTGNFDGGNPSSPSNFNLPYSELRLTGKISEHISYRALAVPSRNFSNTTADGILDDLYISTDIIPKHELQVGQIWLPFGMEAPMYNMDIDFIEYSQISRNLGQGLDRGAQIIGDLGFVNYTAGVYNGVGQNATDNNNGLGYASQVNFTPLYKHPKYGQLVIGGSHLASKNATNHLDGIGGHISYDIGKFGINFEYLHLDGLNSLSTNKGDGLYADLIYRFNDKLTFLARYDRFDPDLNIGRDTRREYVLGANYLLADNVLLMANYTYAHRKLTSESDSNRLGLMTQVMF